MHYEDLKPYVIGSNHKNPRNINIGWLDQSVDYPKGDAPEILVEKLKLLTLFDIDQYLVDGITECYTHPKKL
jgi:hypothetical protein